MRFKSVLAERIIDSVKQIPVLLLPRRLTNTKYKNRPSCCCGGNFKIQPRTIKGDLCKYFTVEIGYGVSWLFLVGLSSKIMTGVRM